MIRTTHICATLLGLMLSAAIASAQDGDERLVEVRPGDTLFGLTRLHYPDEPERWSMIENEILVLNPNAFSGGDRSKLRVGAVLRLPAPLAGPEEPEADTEPPPPLPQHLTVIGSVAELSGTPVAIDVNNRQRLLGLGEHVYRGDAIVTENDSAARLEMSDGAQLHLRPRSRIVIEDYSYAESAPASGRSVITLLQGGFRAITGLIGRHNPSSMRFNTAVATIGVRGTDFGVRICGEGECVLPDAGPFEPGNYFGVLGGEITIGNAAGTTPVHAGEFVFTASPDVAPEPAPDAARLIFSADELALLAPPEEEAMGFFQWLRSRLFRR